MTREITVAPRVDEEAFAVLRRLAKEIDLLLDSTGGSPRPVGNARLEQLGELLWSAADLDAEAVAAAIGEARSEGKHPLRLIIAGDGPHQRLPWELLYSAHPDLGFVGRHPWCVVVRRPRAESGSAPELAPRPFRLLLFIAAPEDLDPEKSRLDYEREEELLFTALDKPWSQGEIEIDVAEDGYLSTLIGRLEQNRYHAVILSLHGTEAKNVQGEQEWGLLFEDEVTGRSSPVAGSGLMAKLDRLPAGHRPGLMALAACRSARGEESAEAIASVARRLHDSGFQRVLGMRLSVLDAAASTFTVELFRRVAQGEPLGRALSLARDEVARGCWLLSSTDGSGHSETLGDPFAQWSLPVLFDRTSGGPLVDAGAAAEIIPRRPAPTVLIGDGTIRLPSRANFIGRRTEVRSHLRAFLDGETPRLFLTGPGGVGKTTLAGFFARAITDRRPGTRLLGFRAPFDLKAIEEPVRREAFDGTEEPALLPSVQAEPDLRTRLDRMLASLARREGRPLTLVLDNLEDLQDLQTLEIHPAHEESVWFLRTTCALQPPTRLLFTGRYAMAELSNGVTICRLGDAPYGDVLRRMHRLGWPLELGPEKKREVYGALGGNHRALEWLAQLLVDRGQAEAEELVSALERVKVPPETPEAVVEVVLEAMRQNLLFGELRGQLTPVQDWLLRAVALYRVPVNEDGLATIDADPDRADENRERLVAYALLETAPDPIHDLDYFLVPPVARQLLRDGGFNSDERGILHEGMGRYHRFQGKYVTRRSSDYLEAIYHFRLAEADEAADELSERVAEFYYRIGGFASVCELTEPIVGRDAPPVPWWALNVHGQCKLRLGEVESGLSAFNRALSLAATQGEEAAILNNISGVHHAQGDYATALRYLAQSLAISTASGSESGAGATLNNMGTTAAAQGDYTAALGYLEQSLTIRRALGDQAGEATTLNNIAMVAHKQGNYGTALGFAKQSLEITRAIGDRAGEGAALNNISQIHTAQGNNDPALESLEQSVGIMRAIGDRAGEGAALNNIALIHMERDDCATALGYLEESLAIRQAIGDQAGEGTTLNNISQIYAARGENAMALETLEKSLAIRRAIGDRAGEGATLNGLAAVHHAQGDNGTALEYLKESLTIRRSIGDRIGLISTLHNMAHIALQARDQERALTLWSEALDLALKSGNAEGIFHVASALGQLLGGGGRGEEARKLLELAVRVGKQAGFPQVGQVEALLLQLRGKEGT